jgi:endonuclease I/V8-like Glu-specific endopeptidase
MKMMHQEAVYQQAETRIKNRIKNRDANLKQLDNLKTDQKFDWTKVETPARLVERVRRLGLYEEAGALMRDPTDKNLGKRVYEQIINANNLLSVTFLSEGARMAQAVGRITLPVPGGTRLGTGFMVSSQIMMTNNHVLDDQLEASNATLEFDYFKRENGTTEPVIRFRLQPSLFFVTDAPLDFTLVAIEDVNSDGEQVIDRGWFPLVGPSGKAVVGERVSIIQHPNGDPQKVVVHDNQIVDVDFDDDFLHYETDTMGGSSGSPVLNIDWDLVALHHAAVGNSNEGIRISSIVTRLREIFEQESVVTRPDVDVNLLAELMAADSPKTAPVPDRGNHVRTMDYGGPRVNTDGTASWVVPVTVTLGVGQPPSGQAPSHSQPSISTGNTSNLQPADDDPNLRSALQALEDTEGRVYYSAAKDKQAQQDYYPCLDGFSKNQLYKTLSELLTDTHTTTLSYKKARLIHLYPWIDRREGRARELRGIYSNKVFDALEVIRQEALMERLREQTIQKRMMQESLEAVDEVFLEELEAAHPFNCEHVVPQSWFNKRKQPRADLHHLFTCEWGCNSFRGNRAYFDFQTEAFRENCGESDNSKFEPKFGKGAVARATLYFLLRYPGDIADSGKEMPKERLQTIIKWAKDDKVDRWERHRNAEIQKVQGNRNPLIDFPDLVDKINFEGGWA